MVAQRTCHRFDVKSGLLRYTKHVRSYIRARCDEIHSRVVIFIPYKMVLIVRNLECKDVVI